MAPKIAADRRRPTIEDLQTTLLHAENQFRRACDQIVLINLQLKGLGVRYKRAKTDNSRSFRYPLRLKLAVVEGVRNMYYDFARQRAEQVEQLRHVIAGDSGDVIIIDSEDEEM